ncbi:hypothetical protein AGR6A_pTi0239 [Agrobacterium sp. NCPPB 925]|nr:hypothetical protein AGR6A_pTi0239 [Agrobacterium sp. NCPPB 925]
MHLVQEALTTLVLVGRDCQYPHHNLRMNRSCERKSRRDACAYVQICTSGDSSESLVRLLECERVVS